MSWFLLSLVCVLGWGCADLCYKKATDENESDGYSHLKLAVWVGLVMGVCSLCLLPFSESGMSAGSLAIGALKYAPASLGYIISMVVGYAGLRYLELSIVSPVQNASGALSAVCIVVYFALTGRAGDIAEELSAADIAGTVIIVAGVIALAAVEQRLSSAENTGAAERKYRSGALALLFPLLYCVFDTVGTAADGIILDDESGLGLGEIDVLILYGLTFMAAGLGAWIYMLLRQKKPYNPFARGEKFKAAAACCEEFGQVFYVFAMASNPVLAAPTVASYCIVSVILSRLMLKEKLTKGQYACIIAVVVGIVILGISEGLAEA